MAAFGEVLSSSITEVVVACWPPEEREGGVAPLAVPHFGSLLRIDSSEQNLRVFAAVFDLVTGPLDGMHKPQAMRMSRKQLRIEQPQIFSLLKTELKAAVIGFERGGIYSSGLSPLPCQVHDFVYAAEAVEVEKVTDGLAFVRSLSRQSSASLPNDELVVAAIYEGYRARNFSYQFLVEAGRALAMALGDDYNRLSAALAKLKTGNRQTVF